MSEFTRSQTVKYKNRKAVVVRVYKNKLWLRVAGKNIFVFKHEVTPPVSTAQVTEILQTLYTPAINAQLAQPNRLAQALKARFGVCFHLPNGNTRFATLPSDILTKAHGAKYVAARMNDPEAFIRVGELVINKNIIESCNVYERKST